ncbi:GNAT family N-acetyltransferase [uncultured Arcticibacterium sp.]|uniref:GNAT family N-acetyltransferase n=1 Tax=uncultured Arcticibacterium sp. TaxID=2173042 RepID=UPI0030F88A83
MNFKIEIAQEKDLEEILTLQKLAYIQEAEIYNNYEITPLTQSIEELQADFKTNTFIKATFNSKIIGSIKGFEENGSVLVGKLIVHPDFQNKGLGSRLMLDIESRFPKANRFWLFTAYKSEPLFVSKARLYRIQKRKSTSESYHDLFRKNGIKKGFRLEAFFKYYILNPYLLRINFSVITSSPLITLTVSSVVTKLVGSE